MGKIVVFKGSPRKNGYSTKLVEQVISGALLFTTGGSSVNPTPGMGNVGIAISGLRNYIFNLNSELKNKGIYVGHVSIGIWMQPNSGVQDKIANIWYDMYTKKDRTEEYVTEDKIDQIN